MAGQRMNGGSTRLLDHIVLAVPDLAGAVADFERLTGIRPVRGGSHVGLGTANHLVGLGGAAYLEIIGPDPEQPPPGRPRPFGLDGLGGALVVTWAIRPPDLDEAVATAVTRGYDPGPAQPMSRRTADGTLLSWRLTPGAADPADGLVPFLIDWGTTPHPSAGALPVLPLRSMAAEHPEPGRIEAQLSALGADLPVHPGPLPRLLVTLDGFDEPIDTAMRAA